MSSSNVFPPPLPPPWPLAVFPWSERPDWMGGCRLWTWVIPMGFGVWKVSEDGKALPQLSREGSSLDAFINRVLR